jgi:hypothetical protein
MTRQALILFGTLSGLVTVACTADHGALPTNTVAIANDARPADLNGFWVRTDEAGSGDFGGTLASIAPAVLTPAAKLEAESAAAALKAEQQILLEKAGNVYRTPVNCLSRDLPFMMQHSGAFDIVQNDTAILVIPEHIGTQHIYMDGRVHPGAAMATSTGMGHSVGHWENGVLVVSTVGMQSSGGIPGGGRKRPETELIERFQLRDAEHLVVNFEWVDPTIYAKSHSYEFTYEKLPADSYAFEGWCDVTDPLQGQSIVVPPQK